MEKKTYDPTIIEDLELLSVSCGVADSVARYRAAFGRRPVFLHVSAPFIARYGGLTELMGLGVLVDPKLKGLAFYLRVNGYG
jgi:hypothetical protein